jgi:hypothetical protein
MIADTWPDDEQEDTEENDPYKYDDEDPTLFDVMYPEDDG